MNWYQEKPDPDPESGNCAPSTREADRLDRHEEVMRRELARVRDRMRARLEANLKRLVPAKYVRLSVCECGFPALNAQIPLGTIYIVDATSRIPAKFICGGCGKISAQKLIWAESREGGRPGYLPEDAFEISEPSAEPPAPDGQ